MARPAGYARPHTACIKGVQPSAFLQRDADSVALLYASELINSMPQ